MGSWLLLFSTCIALQAILWWTCARSQVTGFMSIDCGSNSTSTYVDENGIFWTADVDLIKEGTPMVVASKITGVLKTMRVFDGNQSKYCYSLTNSVVKAGAFFLVRGSFWSGTPPPYMPQNPDGYFRFRLIVDADKWLDLAISYQSNTWITSDIYMRAQRSSIDVCLARNTPGGDAPFISALEIRPLPPTLTSTILMSSGDQVFIPVGRHYDYGVAATSPSYTRYPMDELDRLWLSVMASTANVTTTGSAIDTTIQIDKPPSSILQTAFVSNAYFIKTYSGLDPNDKYIAEFYFAESDPAVNASGQRVFNIYANGDLLTIRAIDVFASVGANTAYGYPAEVFPDAAGVLTFNFSATSTSTFPPYLAAAELFDTRPYTPLTSASVVSVVEEIKTSLDLGSFTGDPCLPIGFGYPWLNCSGASTITSISLSNYGRGGEVPAALNSLTLLKQIYLNGNDMQGTIPDLSSLTVLDTLDLSNNKLTGSIPTYLATLKNLKVLNLENNNLTGEIPAALLLRKQASTLDFQFSGNSLCEVACTTSPSSPMPNGDTPSGRTPSTPKKSNFGTIIGVAVVAGILLMGITIGVVVYRVCRKRRLSALDQPINNKRPISSPQQELGQSLASDADKIIPKHVIQEFTFQEIRNATNNFSTQLGMGGSGLVYKGRLQDGRFVAIKVASNSSHQGSKEFLNEVDLLSRVHHRNLLSLLGYCNEGKLVLVYEFMSNGSLFDCLHGPYAKVSPLSWATRLKILVDAAKGFDYLHYGCSPPIIHRDVKSSNILLNDQLEAKISDFGISRNSFINETGASPTALMGSMGYMDPEYLSTMKMTEKVDVYSFGVLLFEVVCGRVAMFTDTCQQQTHIVEWARSSIERGMIDDIVDVSLQKQYDISSIWKVLEVALACVQFSSFQRPKMSVVSLELKEAERMELESDQRNVLDKPSVGGNDMSFTHVNVR